MEYLKHIIYKKYLHANSKYGSIILSIGLMNTSCAKIRPKDGISPESFCYGKEENTRTYASASSNANQRIKHTSVY